MTEREGVKRIRGRAGRKEGRRLTRERTGKRGKEKRGQI